MTLEVTDHTGAMVARRHITFCPDSYDVERLDPNGPANPTFPQFCSANPFTLGMVWGIDSGWAVNPLAGYFRTPRARLANGRYTVTAAITPMYAALFGIPAADATVTVNARVRKASGGGCPPFCGSRQKVARRGSAVRSAPPASRS